MTELDQLKINFSPQSLTALNVILALVLFGIALELRKEDFTSLLKNKKSALAALFSHFIILPVITFLLVVVIKPTASIALGMILVGACPGGNMSNLFTHLAKGNTALAVSITSVSHLLAIVLTPLNFSFYGSLYPPAAALLKEIHLSVWEVFQTIAVVIIIPLVAGMWLRHYKNNFAERIMPYMKKFSLAAFVFFLVAAFASNARIFVSTLGFILPIVVAHNALALSCGYTFARLLQLPLADSKTITFETGVQNSGLGLILIFGFFNGLGGMALIAACWGVWHLISGGALAFWWGRRSPSVSLNKS
jgi:BASS family bile acid:Na+ symporter